MHRTIAFIGIALSLISLAIRATAAAPPSNGAASARAGSPSASAGELPRPWWSAVESRFRARHARRVGGHGRGVCRSARQRGHGHGRPGNEKRARGRVLGRRIRTVAQRSAPGNLVLGAVQSDAALCQLSHRRRFAASDAQSNWCRRDTDQVFFTRSGDNSETLKPVVVDLHAPPGPGDLRSPG